MPKRIIYIYCVNLYIGYIELKKQTEYYCLLKCRDIKIVSYNRIEKPKAEDNIKCY